jgi:hypothetical protein
MSIHERNVDAVQALVLLLTWPLREEIANDSTLPLAGAMIMMARRAGLHRPAFGNEFVRARGVLSQNDIISRTVLWAYCLISYRKYVEMFGPRIFEIDKHISICFGKGHESAPNNDTRENDLDGYRQLLPLDLRLKLDVSDCLSEGLSSMVRFGLEVVPEGREHDFKHLLGIYEDRFRLIKTQVNVFSSMYLVLGVSSTQNCDTFTSSP